MDTIKTLVIEPLRRPELRDIDPTITAIGKTIGGYAEPLPLDRRTTLWCDEEGAIKNLKPNRTIRLSQDSTSATSPIASAVAEYWIAMTFASWAVSVLRMPGTVAIRSDTTSATSSWSRTRTRATRSSSPVTLYTSLTPSIAARASATWLTWGTSVRMNTIAVITRPG